MLVLIMSSELHWCLVVTMVSRDHISVQHTAVDMPKASDVFMIETSILSGSRTSFFWSLTLAAGSPLYLSLETVDTGH